MISLYIKRRASLARIELNAKEGSFYALSTGSRLPAALLADLREHRTVIVQMLTAWPAIATLRIVTLDRYRPLPPPTWSKPSAWRRNRSPLSCPKRAGSAGS